MKFYEEYLQQRGEKKYRIDQVHQAVYRDLVESFADVTTLPQALREEMVKDLPVSPITLYKERTSADGTVKVLFKTPDGHSIESVLMRHANDRNTVCVSCQVGCAVNCSFCATGKLGLTRNLTADEIVFQVLYFMRKLVKEENQKVKNIVFMGMGEPFHNYDNVLEAIKILNDPKKMAIGIRHITISTSGIVSQIKKFMGEHLQVNLAISLHAPTEKVRSSIMPINNTYSLESLMEVLDAYVAETNRRIFYEYIMLKGTNDTVECAQDLGRLLQGKLAHVNLIPFNPIGIKGMQATTEPEMRKFQKVLMDYGVPSTIRVTLGQDIDGACGQLAAKG